VTPTDRQLPRGALYLTLAQGTFIFLGYLMHTLLARWLTPSLYGLFGVAMVVLGWAEITVNDGVALALQRFLPDLSLSEQAVRRAAGRSQVLISVTVFLVLFLSAPWLAALLRDPHLTGYFRLAFVDILAMGAYAYYRGVLNGWRAFRELAMAIVAYSCTKVTAICLLVYLGFGVQGALVGNILSSLGGLAAGYFWTRGGGAQARPLAGQAHGGGAEQPRVAMGERRILAFVLPTVLLTLASNVLLNVDLMGVKALLGDADQVGYYTAAVNLANAPRLALLAFSFALLPSLSHAIASRDQDQARHYLSQTLRLLALVLFPILALVISTSEPLVVFIFSAPYRPAAPILSILILTYAAYTLYSTLVTALLAENRPGRALAIPVTLLPVALLSVWLGVTWLGLQGAAFASLLSVTLAAAVVAWYVFRRFRPPVQLLSLGRIALAAVVIGVVGRLWSPAGFFLVPGYALLGGLYLLLLLGMGEVHRQDLALVGTWLWWHKGGNEA
jgi:O-antigen/teichoic acid export membrane protein